MLNVIGWCSDIWLDVVDSNGQVLLFLTALTIVSGMNSRRELVLFSATTTQGVPW